MIMKRLMGIMRYCNNGTSQHSSQSQSEQEQPRQQEARRPIRASDLQSITLRSARTHTHHNRVSVTQKMHSLLASISTVDAEHRRRSIWTEIRNLSLTQPHQLHLLDRRGRTSLHVACTKKPPYDIFSTMVRESSALSEKEGTESILVKGDNHGRTPLSLAITNNASVQVILLLIMTDAKSAMVADRAGYLPLHLFACSCAEGSGGYLYDTFLGRQNHYGDIDDTDVLLAKALLDAYEDAASMLTEAGHRTPLHYAVEGEGNVEVIRMLLEACPEALTMDQCGQSPIFLAIKHKASLPVIRLLIETDPSITLQRDKIGMSSFNFLHNDNNGFFPFVRALEYGSSLDILLALCNDAQIILTLDNRGRTALHLALEFVSNFSKLIHLVHAMVRMEPSVVHVTDKAGKSPLDTYFTRYERLILSHAKDSNPAGKLHHFWQILLLLLRATTLCHSIDGGGDKNDAKDKIDMTPMITTLHGEEQVVEEGWQVLHAAVKTNISVGIVKAILHRYPHQVFEREYDSLGKRGVDGGGTYLPVSLAIQGPSSEKNSIVRLMLEQYPEAASIPDGPHGRYLLAMAAEDGSILPDTLQYILGLHPDALWTVDPKTGLYPFMLAAVSKEHNTGNDGEWQVKQKPKTEVEASIRKRQFLNKSFVYWGFSVDLNLIQINSIYELLLAGPDLVGTILDGNTGNSGSCSSSFVVD